MDIAHLTREELLALAAELLVAPAAKGDDLKESLSLQRTLVSSLQVHQIELEAQNHDLREAQADLEESRNRYAELFDLAPMAYLSCDRRGVITDLNLTGATLLGGNRESLIAVPFAAIVKLHEPGAFYAYLQACANQRGRVTADLQGLVRGETVYLHVMTMPVFDVTGSICGFRSALADVTSQRQAEFEYQAALASEQVLRSRLEALDHATSQLLSRLATGERANTAELLKLIAVKASGLSSSDRARASVSVRGEGEGPLVATFGEAGLSAVPSEVVSEEVEFRYGATELGALRVERLQTTATERDHARTTLRMFAERVGSAIEISRRSQLELRHRMQLDLLIRASGELTECLDMETTLLALARIPRLITAELACWCSVHIAHEDGFKLCASAEHQAFTGSRPCAEGSFDPNFGFDAVHLDSAIGEVSRTRRSRIFQATQLREHSAHQIDLELRCLCQTRELSSLFLVPMVARSKLLGVWCIGIDGQRHDTEPLACFEEIAMRCAFALDNASLFEDRTSAVQSRDNLLAIVSHDLRNPLNAIALTAKSLARPPEVPERRSSRRQLDLIARSAHHMDLLLNDLLTASCLEGDRLSMVREPQDGIALVREAFQIAEPAAHAKSIRLVVVPSAEALHPISADRHRILQVFANLIGNATKFTQSGGMISLGATSEGPCIRFWVSDTGTGIPMHELPRVFDRHWTSDTHSRGLGLGLFICRAIVEAHGGRMGAQSKVGEGSTFAFTIPLASAMVASATCTHLS